MAQPRNAGKQLPRIVEGPEATSAIITPGARSFRRFLGGSAVRASSFTYEGVEFSFQAERDGEMYLGIMYPNPDQAMQSAKHAAAVNHRMTPKGELRPYPIERYGDVLAILNTYQMPEGEAPPDINEVWRLFDEDTELFTNMVGAALEVLGVGGSSSVNSGLAAWSAVFTLATRAHALAKSGSDKTSLVAVVTDLFQVARAAIGDYKLNAKDVLTETITLDPELESLLGN